MYRAIGLLRPDTDFTLDETHKRLTEKFPGFEVTRNGEQIIVSQGEWWIAIALTSSAEVAMEIEGLVGHLAGVEPSEAEEYVAAGRRVDVWTDVPDQFMEHFDDYLKMIEVLKTFKGLLAVDPNERGLL